MQRSGDDARVNYCSSGEKEELPPTPCLPTIKCPSRRSWEVAEREFGGCEEMGLWTDGDKGTSFSSVAPPGSLSVINVPVLVTRAYP